MSVLSDVRNVCWKRAYDLEQSHGSIKQIAFDEKRAKIIYADGYWFFIGESGCTGKDDKKTVQVFSNQSYQIDIDHDKDTNTAFFLVSKDDGATELFKVYEDGHVVFSNGFTIDVDGNIVASWLSAYAKTLLDDADAAAARDTLGVTELWNQIYQALAGNSWNFFFSDDVSDIGTYYYMYSQQTEDTLTELTSDALSTGNDQLLWSFVSIAGLPDINILALGIYAVTAFLRKTGTKDVNVYCKLFSRTAGGEETLIITTSLSNDLTLERAQYAGAAYLNADKPIDSTDRLVLKVYANVTGVGSNPTVTLSMEDTYDSRIAIRVTSSAFSNQLVDADGDTKVWIDGSNVVHVKTNGVERVTIDADGIKDKTGLIMPPGAMVSYGGSTAPTGWLLCDGSSLLRTGIYADLFAAIGTTYGSVDETHFNIPDRRGIFARGAGTSEKLVDANGNPFAGVLGTYQNDKIQGHKHTLGAWATEFFVPAGETYGSYMQPTDTGNPKNDGTNGTPRTGTETNPANLGVNFIIKY